MTYRGEFRISDRTLANMNTPTKMKMTIMGASFPLTRHVCFAQPSSIRLSKQILNESNWHHNSPSVHGGGA